MSALALLVNPPAIAEPRTGRKVVGVDIQDPLRDAGPEAEARAHQRDIAQRCYLNNRDKVLAKKRTYYQENRELILARARAAYRRSKGLAE